MAASSSRWPIRAMAFAANPRGERAVAQHAAITFVRPGTRRRDAGRRGGGADARRPLRHLRRARHARRTASWWRSSAAIRARIRGQVVGGMRCAGPRSDRNRVARRDRRVAARAAGVDAAPRLRERAALPRRVRSRRRASGRFPRRSTICAKFPFTTKQDLRANYPFGMFAVPREKLVRVHASSGTTGKPTVVGLHREGHRDLGACRRALDLRRRRPAGDDRACRLRLRPVHRRPGRALRRGAAGLHGGAGVGRHDRAAGAVDHRFPPRRDHGDAELHAGDPGRIPPRRASIRAPAR